MKILYVLLFTLLNVINITHTKPFPYKQFFKFGPVPKLEDDEERKSEFLCSYGMEQATLCDCDRNCMKYQTCCIDYLWNVSSTTMSSLSTYIKQFIRESKKYKQLKCTPIISGLTRQSLHVTENLLMISKCPKAVVDRKLRYKCRNNKFDLKNLPVIGDDAYIYKNKHCAKCNRVTKFKYLKVRADCHDKVVTKPSNNTQQQQQKTHILDEYSKCSIDIVEEPEQIKIAKRCSTRVVNKCTRTVLGKPTITPSNNNVCRLCKYYNAGVYSPDGRCCKNPHCCYEQFRNGSKVIGYPDTCVKVYPATAGRAPIIRFITLPTYSFLLTYKTATELHDDTEDIACLPGDLLDPDCLDDLSCSYGYTRVGSKCEKDTPRDIVSKIDVYADDYEKNCFGTDVYIVIAVNNEEEDTTKNILRYLNGSMLSSDYKTMHQNNTHLILKVTERNYINVTNHIPNVYSYEVIRTSVPVLYPTELYGIDFTRSFNGPRMCVSPIIHDKKTFNISSNCFISINNSVLYVNDYVLFTRRVKTDAQQEYLVTCKQFHLYKPCLLRTINNYTILPNNTIQTISNLTFDPEDYQPMGDGVGVCVDKSNISNIWRDIVNAVEGYLTVIGCALSIIAYVWTILTYTLIAELRTIPGKNIVCLCLMLMSCDILMLLSMVTAWCKYIAILLHFFALSAQFWSVITAFDIWSTFQGKSLSRNMKSKKRFLCYCLWGWISPLCFVLLCIILDVTKIAEVGYGKYGICWITSLPARIVTYIAPVGASILFTISILTYTINRIYRQCNKSKTLLKKRGGENVSLARMALKLVLLLGVIEIVGFLQFRGDQDINWVFTSIFQLLYVIVRSFRGVFVWLLYVVTDRVFKIYRNIREQRLYKTSVTKLTSVGTTRTFSTRSSENFNTTLTIAPTPTLLH